MISQLAYKFMTDGSMNGLPFSASDKLYDTRLKWSCTTLYRACLITKRKFVDKKIR